MCCCYCWLYPCRPCCPTYQNTPYLVALVDCTDICWATAFLKDFGNISWKNTTADILIEDQLWPPLDKATVDQEQELQNLAELAWGIPSWYESSTEVVYQRYLPLSTGFFFFFCITGLKNSIAVDAYWNIGSLLVLKLEDLLHASYNDRTYCTPVIMIGPIVYQL